MKSRPSVFKKLAKITLKISCGIDRIAFLWYNIEKINTCKEGFVNEKI